MSRQGGARIESLWLLGKRTVEMFMCALMYIYVHVPACVQVHVVTRSEVEMVERATRRRQEK